MGNVHTLNVHVAGLGPEPEGEPPSGSTTVPAGAAQAPAAAVQTGVLTCGRRRAPATASSATQTDESASAADVVLNIPGIDEVVPVAVARVAATRTWTTSTPHARRQQIDFRPIPITDLPLPVGRRPTIAELTSPDIRVYAVWHIPGYANLTGIHWSEGRFCWQCVRSLAWNTVSGNDPAASQDDAWSQLRWARRHGTTHQQLETTFRSQPPHVHQIIYFHWRRR
jgi:hypothetical protein